MVLKECAKQYAESESESSSEDEGKDAGVHCSGVLVGAWLSVRWLWPGGGRAVSEQLQQALLTMVGKPVRELEFVNISQKLKDLGLAEQFPPSVLPLRLCIAG